MEDRKDLNGMPPQGPENDPLQQQYDQDAQQIWNNAAWENGQYAPYDQNQVNNYYQQQQPYYTQDYNYTDQQSGEFYPQQQPYGNNGFYDGAQNNNQNSYYGQPGSDYGYNDSYQQNSYQHVPDPQYFNTDNSSYQTPGSYDDSELPPDDDDMKFEDDPNKENKPNHNNNGSADSYDDDRDAGDYEGEDDEYYDDEYEEDEGFIGKIKGALAGIPPKVLYLAGGGLVAVVTAIVLFAVVLPNSKNKQVEVELTPTPEPTATIEPTPVPTEAPTPTPHPIGTPLTFGMVGDVVVTIQERLHELGYIDMPTLEDGTQQFTTRYATTTKNGIRLFQSKNGLDIDGQCGPATYDLLMSDACKAYFVSRNDTDDFTGGKIKRMQERLIELGYLKAGATGTCGEQTVLAIQKFQQKNGLDPDGKAGQQTLQLMYGSCIAADGSQAGPCTWASIDSATVPAAAGELAGAVADAVTDAVNDATATTSPEPEASTTPSALNDLDDTDTE